MEINKIDSLDFKTLMRVMSSQEISLVQKEKFIQKNYLKINELLDAKISSQDYKGLMQKRGLKKFRPLKNSFTKKVDKILLAKALEIKPSDVSGYIKNVVADINDINKIKFLEPEKMDILKTYVYRHGSKDELVSFLDYELEQASDMVKTLYRTLRYYSGGVADYFIRPIHRMDNKTLIKVYRIIDKHIKKDFEAEKISEAQSEKLARWALIRIYKIQNNSQLINAIKTYKVLN